MKPNPLLIPPGALLRLSQLLTDAGQGKHADEKWRTLTVDEHLQAAMRHILTHASGEEIDKDYLQTHLVHALARLMFAVELQGAQDVRRADTSGWVDGKGVLATGDCWHVFVAEGATLGRCEKCGVIGFPPEILRKVCQHDWCCLESPGPGCGCWKCGATRG